MPRLHSIFHEQNIMQYNQKSHLVQVQKKYFCSEVNQVEKSIDQPGIEFNWSSIKKMRSTCLKGTYLFDREYQWFLTWSSLLVSHTCNLSTFFIGISNPTCPVWNSSSPPVYTISSFCIFYYSIIQQTFVEYPYVLWTVHNYRKGWTQ